MPSKDIRHQFNMGVDDDYLEILEEIPKSPASNTRLKWKPRQQNFDTSKKFLIKLKQANQKITQQKDIILELQDKLKHQTGKLEEATKMLTHQKKLLQSSQRSKMKLRHELDLERKHGREILFKLLEFFKHIDSEFSFTIDVLNGKSVENSSHQKYATIPHTNIIGIENKLKQLSIGVANKLKKVKNMETERVTELENAKQTLVQIKAKNLTTMATTSTQTNMTSIDFDKPFYLISSKSPDLSPISTNHQAPIRLRLKRAHYDYQQHNGFKNSSDCPTKCKVANMKNHSVDNSKIIRTAQISTTNYNSHLDFDKRHEVDNKKHELNLFYCACGLTFSSQEWLNNHIKLFDTLWGSEKDAMKGNVCANVTQKPIIQTSVVVENIQK